MLPDRVSNPGPLTYESGALPIALRGPAHEALNHSPEYTGQSQTFNFEIWVTFDQGQRMTLTFDTHSISLTYLAECFKQL